MSNEIWTPRTVDFDLEPAILMARNEINGKNPAHLIDNLNRQVKRSDSGIVYAVLRGDEPEEYSATDAVVMFNPFANTATANMLVRAEFIREVAKHADVRDETGKLKSIIMLASPGMHGSKLQLNHSEKSKIKHGDLGPAAEKYLKTVTALDYGRIALMGASQGADLAISGSSPSIKLDLDRTALAVAEPASVVDRSWPRLAKDFANAGPDIDDRAKDTGLTALNAAHDIRSDYYNFWLSMFSPTNWRLMSRAMTHASFEAQMQSIIEGGELDRLVVGYGDRSTITPAQSIEPSIAKLHKSVHSDQLLSVEVKGGTHAWSEELTVLAKLYLKALS
jgi:hypothetical protein